MKIGSKSRTLRRTLKLSAPKKSINIFHKRLKMGFPLDLAMIAGSAPNNLLKQAITSSFC